MSVLGVVGLPGSGKTIYGVHRCLTLLGDKRRRAAQVHSNVRIDHDRAHYLEGWEGVENGPPGLYLLDEIPAWLDARRHAVAPDAVLNRWRQTRKVRWDVIWTAQAESMVDSRVRAVTDWVFRVDAFLPVPAKYDRETDEIVRYRHPSAVRVRQFRPGHADDNLAKHVRSSRWIPWYPTLGRAARLYDTEQEIGLASHLADRVDRQKGVTGEVPSCSDGPRDGDRLGAVDAGGAGQHPDDLRAAGAGGDGGRVLRGTSPPLYRRLR